MRRQLLVALDPRVVPKFVTDFSRSENHVEGTPRKHVKPYVKPLVFNPVHLEVSRYYPVEI